MKKLFLIFFVMFFAVLSFSCSDESTKVDDENTDTWDQTADDNQETQDDNQTFEDNQTTPDDSQTTPDDSQTTNDDNQTTPDNEVDDDTVTDKEVSDDDTVVTDEDPDEVVPDTDEEIHGNDKGNEDNDLDIEITDEDTEHVEVECPAGTVGLAIKTFYNDGTDNVTGGGTVTRNPAGDPTEDSELTCYSLNATVSLTVVPDTGFDFSKWKGSGSSSVTGTYPNFSVTLGTEKVTLRAEFAPQ